MRSQSEEGPSFVLANGPGVGIVAMRTCRSCRSVVRLHAFVTEGHDYCSKTCLCRGMGHKSKKDCCLHCRGPLVKQVPSVPQEIVRSPRKVAKSMKRRKSQRPPALV